LAKNIFTKAARKMLVKMTNGFVEFAELQRLAILRVMQTSQDKSFPQM